MCGKQIAGPRESRYHLLYTVVSTMLNTFNAEVGPLPGDGSQDSGALAWHT